MGQQDPRVDAYISKANPFAQPILAHLRKLVHQACPDVEETIKWGFPNFDYKGSFCSMTAFKAHCAFRFWKGSLLNNRELFQDNQKEGVRHLGQISSKADLPDDASLLAYIREAKKLNDDGIKLPVDKKKKATAEKIEIPADLKKLLRANPTADKTFTAFAPSHRKEYIQWINEAKTEATRQKRINTTLEWLTEGKSRHWKYQ